MSHWSSRWNTMMNRTRTLTRESMQLMRLLVRQPRNMRQVLLDQARLSNQLANNLLLMDKQVSLVRYYGVTGYLREKEWLPSSSLAKSALSSSASSSDDAKSKPASSSSTVAQVSFMVTSAMRQELGELGYEPLQIKQLKPIEARLILEHKVQPDQQASQLPALLAQHEEEQERQAAEAAAEAARVQEQQQQQQEQALHSQNEEAQQRVAEPADQQHQENWFASRNELDDNHDDSKPWLPPPSSTSAVPCKWFEIIETNRETGTSDVVALYLSESEAQLGLETKELFANRRAHELGRDAALTTYEIRSTMK